MESAVTVQHIKSDDILNVSLYHYYLVIDTRDEIAYNEGHIATSHNFPCSSSSTNENQLKKFTKFLDTIANGNPPEFFNPVILYSESDSHVECVKFANWLSETLKNMKQRKLTLPLLGTDSQSKSYVEDEYNPFTSLVDRLVNSCNKIWVLDCGYAKFKEEYPFLCGHIKYSDMEPTPQKILPNLFLGTRGFKIYPNMINNLGITHLIIAKGLQFENVKHLCVLECEVEDKNDQNLTTCFESCVQFISQASLLPNSRIFVQLHGRSRSAGIIMAYLISQKNMEIRDAFEFVFSKCDKISFNEVWAPQLAEFKNNINRRTSIKN